jgi:hypothetical protein
VGKYKIIPYAMSLCVASAAFLVGNLEAQSQRAVVRAEVKHDVSRALRSLAPQHFASKVPASGREEEAENRRSLRKPPSKTHIALRTHDAVAQTTTLAGSALVPGHNFDGVSAMGRAVPDTNGAVGLTQYFQWVNVDFQIFDKNTGASIYGPADAATLWTGFAPCNATDDSDVVVEYDKIANVWVLEQHVAGASGSNYQCIAVSTSSDATGTYNRYAFPLPGNFPDYPKISVWPDAYYLTINEQDPTTFAALGAYVCALDRTSMLAGNPATAQCFQLSSSFNSLLPADLDGSILPPAGSPNYLMNLGSNNASLNLWQFHVDWKNPANTTLTGPTNVPVAAFVNTCGTSSNCAPQSGTTQLVDGLGGRLMFRLAYRHFADGHESIVATHSVSTPAAVRWYEVQSPGNNPVVFQQGTFAPDSNYRWMGSIAMDQVGDIAVGYSVSSASMFPAIRYTGRLQSDPLGTMEAETSIIEGTGAQVGSNRWGDYTAMTIDPEDDCTFWYTNEYIVSNGDLNWHTRIASFSFPSCTGNLPVTLAPTGLSFAMQPVGTTSAPQNVTLTNQQSVALNITSVVASGDYAESDNCVSSSPIAAHGTCNISVTFKPITSGTRIGQVTVSDDAGQGSQVVSMTGSAAAPMLSLSRGNLRFSVLAGSTSAAQAVSLKNSGNGPLTVSSIAASGDYAETDNCVNASPLVSGATCTINVTFTPTVTGSVPGVITIVDNGVNGAPHRIQLSGSGLVTIAVSPTILTFPQTTVGSISAPMTVTITNNAATAQNISWVAGGDFAAVGGGTSPCGNSLNAASSCTLSVTFSPTTNGTGGLVRGGLAVTDTATGVSFNPQSVSLSGSATGGPPANPLTFSPGSMNFGNVAIGSTKTGSAQLTNSSGVPVKLSSLTASGEYGVTPSGTSPCTNGLLLAAGAKCGFSVSLTPTGGGSLSGSVTVVDNVTSGPSIQTYNLVGVGFWPITLSPGSMTFPATAVGSTSSPLQVTVTNRSPISVTLETLVVSGDYNLVSLGGNPCNPGTVLSPNGACTFGISFSPTAKGTIFGAVTLSHSAPNSPQVTAMQGTGQ